VRTFDAAIIGGGIIGGSIAFELTRHGLRVVVLDRQEPGREASWAAGGMISPTPHLPEDVHLAPFAKASAALYAEFVSAIESATGRTVDYRADGAMELFLSPDAEEKRDQTIAHLARLGFETRALSGDDARQMEPEITPNVRAALLLPTEGRGNPRELTQAVLIAAAQCGAEIRADADVVSVSRNGAAVDGVVFARTSGGGERTKNAATETIRAKHVVLAAGCFSAQIGGVEDLAPVRPVRGQMVALAPRSQTLRHSLRSEFGYLVPWSDGRVVGGSTLEDAGFEKAVTPEGLSRILRAVSEITPGLRGAPIVETWSGLRPDTPDHLPLLGPTELPGLIVATGHYRNGILLAPATALAVREWITSGRTSLPVEAFSPMRLAGKARTANR